MNKLDTVSFDNTDIVLIDTPNLEYLDYLDNVAHKYSIPIMHRLVEAKLNILHILRFEEIEVSFQNILSLIRACSHAQHISLLGFMLRVWLNLYFCFCFCFFRGKKKAGLPFFSSR